MSRWRIATALVIAAIVLNLGLTQFRTDRTKTYWDGRVVNTVSEKPLFITTISVADTNCLKGAPCKIRALATEKGWYARMGVSWWGAVTGGFIVPYFFVTAAICLALTQIQGRQGKITGAIMLSLGFGTLLPLAYLIIRTPSSTPLSKIFDETARSGLAFIAMIALTIAAIGFWLIARSTMRTDGTPLFRE